LEAPKKEFFTFNNSAHSPNMEESEKFIQIFRKIALENIINSGKIDHVPVSDAKTP
jgi:hypothetical protein